MYPYMRKLFKKHEHGTHKDQATDGLQHRDTVLGAEGFYAMNALLAKIDGRCMGAFQLVLKLDNYLLHSMRVTDIPYARDISMGRLFMSASENRALK